MSVHKWHSNNLDLKTGRDSGYNFQEETNAVGVTRKPTIDSFIFHIQMESMVPPKKKKQFFQQSQVSLIPLDSWVL